jgi:hypothetical protein
MVVVHFAIHQAKKNCHIMLDILKREDCTDGEVECAKHIETFLLESLKYVAKKGNLELKTTKIRSKKITKQAGVDGDGRRNCSSGAGTG